MKLSENQEKDIEAIRNLPDDKIDTSDAPEVLDWSSARRGVLYYPAKQEVTLPLDKYVSDWFESTYPEIEERHEAMNRVLMEHVRCMSRS